MPRLAAINVNGLNGRSGVAEHGDIHLGCGDRRESTPDEHFRRWMFCWARGRETRWTDVLPSLRDCVRNREVAACVSSQKRSDDRSRWAGATGLVGCRTSTSARRERRSS